MCDEAVDDCLAALKFFPGWFVASKAIKKKFYALYADKIYSTLMKVLVMPYLIVMKWVYSR